MTKRDKTAFMYLLLFLLFIVAVTAGMLASAFTKDPVDIIEATETPEQLESTTETATTAMAPTTPPETTETVEATSIQPTTEKPSESLTEPHSVIEEAEQLTEFELEYITALNALRREHGLSEVTYVKRDTTSRQQYAINDWNTYKKAWRESRWTPTAAFWHHQDAVVALGYDSENVLTGQRDYTATEAIELFQSSPSHAIKELDEFLREVTVYKIKFVDYAGDEATQVVELFISEE